ncbi:MAG: GNAT family N-acetyltransferase [Desulfopila sp.]
MPKSIEIRSAEFADSGKIIEFNGRMAEETEGVKLDPDVLYSGVQAVLKEPGHGFYLIAVAGGQVVGCLLVTTEWSDWRNGEFWWIQSVYVEPEFRRRGVFRSLYEATRQRAQKSDRVCGFRLYVERENVQAQKTYTRLGMKETAYRMLEALFEKER